MESDSLILKEEKPIHTLYKIFNENLVLLQANKPVYYRDLLITSFIFDLDKIFLNKNECCYLKDDNITMKKGNESISFLPNKPYLNKGYRNRFSCYPLVNFLEDGIYLVNKKRGRFLNIYFENLYYFLKADMFNTYHDCENISIFCYKDTVFKELGSLQDLVKKLNNNIRDALSNRIYIFSDLFNNNNDPDCQVVIPVDEFVVLCSSVRTNDVCYLDLRYFSLSDKNDFINFRNAFTVVKRQSVYQIWNQQNHLLSHDCDLISESVLNLPFYAYESMFGTIP